MPTMGESLAQLIPALDDDFESDMMPLGDIVVTGVELVPVVHFLVKDYRPDATGEVGDPWARLLPLDAAQPPTGQPRIPPVSLTIEIMRAAVAKYLDTRIAAGMAPNEAMKLVTGDYTDWGIADSILQFAVYGEEVFN